VITARGLARTYRSKHSTVEAVKGVDLDVAEGEVVGFLGPNGAGKTTTLRILTTLLDPTAGEATVAGCDLRTDPVGVRRRIGYVPQGGSTYPEALAGEEIVDHARLYGLTTGAAREHGRRLFDQLDLDGMWERQTKTLSGGQRRRLDIAMGLVHEPALLFLDEPTTGLDPQARANLWQHIRSLRDDLGRTVFLTTHYLEEADALCDRILIIDDGRIVAEGAPEELKRRVSGDAVVLTLHDDGDRPAATRVAAALAGVTDLPTAGPTVAGPPPDGPPSAGPPADPGSDPSAGPPSGGPPPNEVAEPAVGPSRLVFRVPDGGSALPGLLRALDAAGVQLAGVEVHRPTLDDVFLTLTGRSLRDEPAVRTRREALR
jgi:ABC-2 type transport system ATP-binding protein